LSVRNSFYWLKPTFSITTSSCASRLDDDEQQLWDSSKEQVKCSKCLACAFDIFHEFYGPIYHELYSAYKFVLILSCTQVSCERVFSIFKIIETRLRLILGQELLQDFVLFYVERDFHIDYEKVIDDIASSSKNLRVTLNCNRFW